MATILRITLLSGRYGATPWDRSEFEGQVEYPPSPWRLLRAILHGAFLLSSERDQLPEGVGAMVETLAACQPSYHLPFGEFGQIRGFRPVYGKEPVPPLETFGGGYSHAQGKRRSFIDSFLQLGAGTAIHVTWPVDLSADQRSLLGDCLAGLSYLGRAEYPALWQLVPAMPEANCCPDPAGTLQVLGSQPDGVISGLLINPQTAREQGRQALPGQQWLSYRYCPDRQAPRLGGSEAAAVNHALFACLAHPSLPATAGLAWTDRLHRALLQRCPVSALFSGMVAGQPLGEDQRAWYRWHETEDSITALEVVSPQPFSEAEIEALQQLRRLYGRGGVEVPLRLMQLDAMPLKRACRLLTATPMLLYTTPREGKLQRHPASQAIQSLLWGLGEEGKLEPSLFQLQGEAISAGHPERGEIRARLVEVIDRARVSGRGERKAASSLGFQVEISSVQPLPALGVGWGRHFGAGRLEAVA
ncbi:MAG: type I-G CRISPR-associated protein Csb2 [Cyanobium sp.]